MCKGFPSRWFLRYHGGLHACKAWKFLTRASLRGDSFFAHFVAVFASFDILGLNLHECNFRHVESYLQFFYTKIENKTKLAN